MPKPATRLTDKAIKNTKIKKGEYCLSDGNGLHIRIRPNGTKSWQFKYQDPSTKKSKKISLGSYSNLSLKDSRKIAQEYQNILAQGIDPRTYIEKCKLDAIRKESSTFLSVAEQWFQRKQKSISPAHAERVWRTLEKYVFPKLGNVAIENITRRNTIQVLRPLEERQKLSTIKRICQSLNQIMEYGVDCDLIIANPLTRMNKAFEKHQVKHMATIRPELLGELLNRLDRSKTLQDKTKLLILWQLHTITRPKEAAKARWKDIDIEARCWTIPATEMKRRKAHRIPLTNSALEILTLIKPHSYGKEYVFPGERLRGDHISVYTANAALKRSLGFKDNLVAHGLRSIASTAMHEHGFDTLQIEACLSHSDQNETRSSYNRSDFFEQRKEIMDWWSTFIDNAFIKSVI